jgi:hypothetical protein
MRGGEGECDEAEGNETRGEAAAEFAGKSPPPALEGARAGR